MVRALLVGVLLLAACSDPEVSFPTVSGVTATQDDEGRWILCVTRGGEVLHGGKSLTLDEVDALIERTGDEAQFVLRADGDAIWCHVQWVLALLGKHLHGKAELFFHRDDRPRTLALQPMSGYFGLFWFHPEEAKPFLVQVALEPPVYHLGNLSTSDPEQLGSWIRQGNEMCFGEARFGVEIDMRMPFRTCISAMIEFEKAPGARVRWGMELPHPWVAKQRPLPMPAESDQTPSVYWWSDRSFEVLDSLLLPLADASELDKGDDPEGIGDCNHASGLAGGGWAW